MFISKVTAWEANLTGKNADYKKACLSIEYSHKKQGLNQVMIKCMAKFLCHCSPFQMFMLFANTERTGDWKGTSKSQPHWSLLWHATCIWHSWAIQPEAVRISGSLLWCKQSLPELTGQFPRCFEGGERGKGAEHLSQLLGSPVGFSFWRKHCFQNSSSQWQCHTAGTIWRAMCTGCLSSSMTLQHSLTVSLDVLLEVSCRALIPPSGPTPNGRIGPGISRGPWIPPNPGGKEKTFKTYIWNLLCATLCSSHFLHLKELNLHSLRAKDPGGFFLINPPSLRSNVAT